MYSDYHHMNMFHGMGMLFWIVFFIIVVFLLINISKKRKDTINKDSALDILKSRYAKGEISKTDFEQIKKDIL